MRLSGRNLRCVRGGREIFSRLNFDVAAGKALAITGVNGAGKSSLLRMIAGLLPISDGVISASGGDRELTLAEQAHYVGHRDALKPALTVAENLQFWRSFLGGTTRSPQECLDGVGLAHAAHLPAAVLSAGQRRRLSIARLLLVHRALWLLDEPTSALDSAGQKIVGALMKAHLRNGGLILAATHGPIGVTAKELRIGGRS